MSNILTIYDMLAATNITVGSTSIAVKDADEIPNRVLAADLPVRLLTPIADLGGSGVTSSTVWAGGSGSVVRQATWVIHDVMLWRPVALDVGVKAWAKQLLAYEAEYFSMLETLALPGVVRVDASLQPSVIEYPLYSGNLYAGVRVMLTVVEKW